MGVDLQPRALGPATARLSHRSGPWTPRKPVFGCHKWEVSWEIIHFLIGLSRINHPFWAPPILRNPQNGFVGTPWRSNLIFCFPFSPRNVSLATSGLVYRCLLWFSKRHGRPQTFSPSFWIIIESMNWSSLNFGCLLIVSSDVLVRCFEGTSASLGQNLCQASHFFGDIVESTNSQMQIEQWDCPWLSATSKYW